MLCSLKQSKHADRKIWVCCHGDRECIRELHHFAVRHSNDVISVRRLNDESSAPCALTVLSERTYRVFFEQI